jgi:hypothetical protein
VTPSRVLPFCGAPRVAALRDGVGKAVAELRKRNEVLEYDDGADRAKEQYFGDTARQAALAVVAIFWNQPAI